MTVRGDDADGVLFEKSMRESGVDVSQIIPRTHGHSGKALSLLKIAVFANDVACKCHCSKLVSKCCDTWSSAPHIVCSLVNYGE